jgi:sporulation protein YlmC with PRC-barrel domain
MTTQSGHALIPAERVNGTDVYSQSGDKLGRVEDIAIDKVSGKVAYAILSFGGFLGMGERHAPVPWSVLTYDTEKRGYVIPLTEGAIKDAPSFTPQELSGWNDTHMRSNIFEYYASFGAQPYWL